MATLFDVAVQYSADLIGYSAQHELRLLVEVKAGLYWAGRDLRAWTADNWSSFFEEVTGTLLPPANEPSAYYFMLVTPTHIAFWEPASDWRKPTWMLEAADSLDAVVDTRKVALPYLNGEELAFLVSAWLKGASLTSEAALAAQPAQRWLVESGLHQQIYQGIIQLNTAQEQAYAAVA